MVVRIHDLSRLNFSNRKTMGLDAKYRFESSGLKFDSLFSKNYLEIKLKVRF